MRVIAVDPGGVTGIAVYDEDWSEPSVRETPDYDSTVFALTTEINHHRGIDALVCEGFSIRANTHKLDASAFSHTTDLIGACRLLAHERGIPFVRQTPAQAKGFATDDKLRRLGWYTPSPGGHGNDATRHLLTYFARTHYLPVLEQLTSDHEETP